MSRKKTTIKVESGTNQGLPPELAREAMKDLVTRMFHGIFSYVFLFAVVATTTAYRANHPSLFWGMVATGLAGMIIRLVLMMHRERLQDIPAIWLNAQLMLSVCLSSGACGLLYASTLRYYGFESWSFTFILMNIVGIASGSTISYTPNFKLLRPHLLLLLLPALVQGVVLGGVRGNSFAATTAMLTAFLMLQGHRLHAIYYSILHGRAMEGARARELESARVAAESANLAKSRFLANMSHEVRTPMHGVLGMAQLAMTAETLEESRDYVKALHHAASGLLHVLNDILDFSKIEAGKLALENVSFSVRQVVDEVRIIVLPQASAKKLILACRVDESVPDLLVGDPARLRQVLLNLMGNATKFTEHGSVMLEVASAAPADEPGGRTSLHFRLSDTGIGISEGQRKLLFQAFAQADTSISRKFGGTGLGLAICSQLVHLMDGDISVESTPGVGSVFQFTCTFGIASEPASAAVRAPRTALTTSMHILLAEDNVINQRLAMKLLARMGHKVELVSTGWEAVRAWEKKEFDLILMDNQMPELDGTEAVKIIRNDEASSGRKRTPIIALTASAMAGDRERFLAAGMDGYLGKPFSADDLDATLAGSASQHLAAT